MRLCGRWRLRRKISRRCYRRSRCVASILPARSTARRGSCKIRCCVRRASHGAHRQRARFHGSAAHSGGRQSGAVALSVRTRSRRERVDAKMPADVRPSRLPRAPLARADHDLQCGGQGECVVNPLRWSGDPACPLQVRQRGAQPLQPHGNELVHAQCDELVFQGVPVSAVPEGLQQVSPEASGMLPIIVPSLLQALKHVPNVSIGLSQCRSARGRHGMGQSHRKHLGKDLHRCDSQALQIQMGLVLQTELSTLNKLVAPDFKLPPS
mmetsp:Transcript_49899/g.131571  ORF Transcript_49899/g.131571 Transcript_49899/m.131571 type:complete len:267 (+) Transcript_49899:505-1305(+)